MEEVVVVATGLDAGEVGERTVAGGKAAATVLADVEHVAAGRVRPSIFVAGVGLGLKGKERKENGGK